MDYNKVDMYLVANAKYFPEDKIVYLKEKLRNVSEDRFSLIYSVDLKDPTVLLVVSIFLGTLGIDRFMLGDIGMGILKLLTCGCCGILTLIDWFLVMGRTKEKNFNKLMGLL